MVETATNGGVVESLAAVGGSVDELNAGTVVEVETNALCLQGHTVAERRGKRRRTTESIEVGGRFGADRTGDVDWLTPRRGVEHNRIGGGTKETRVVQTNRRRFALRTSQCVAALEHARLDGNALTARIADRFVIALSLQTNRTKTRHVVGGDRRGKTGAGIDAGNVHAGDGSGGRVATKLAGVRSGAVSRRGRHCGRVEEHLASRRRRTAHAERAACSRRVQLSHVECAHRRRRIRTSVACDV